MNDYLLDITLPAYMNQEFMSLIPAQREHINELVNKGTISGYSLALDRSKLWVTLRGRSEGDVQEVFESFPLYDYMEGVFIPLMFHQSPSYTLPQMSLN